MGGTCKGEHHLPGCALPEKPELAFLCLAQGKAWTGNKIYGNLQTKHRDCWWSGRRHPTGFDTYRVLTRIVTIWRRGNFFCLFMFWGCVGGCWTQKASSWVRTPKHSGFRTASHDLHTYIYVYIYIDIHTYVYKVFSLF